MNFNLNNQTTASPLSAPGQLFNRAGQSQQSYQGPTIGPAPAQPVMRQDQSRFSTVSRLIGVMPGVLLPFGPLPTLQGLNPIPTLRKLPDTILRGLERGWQALKDTFTFQFEESGRLGTAREAEANCGPASSSMILKQFGISSPTMQQLRRLVGAPIGTGGGAFALSTRQVAEAVKKTASQQGRVINYDIKGLSSNVDTVLNDMRRRLAAGEKLILLTSGLNSLSRGHYMVVKEVRPDGSILIDDPGRSQGENRVHTRAQLAKALSMRSQHYGLDNSLIAFRG